MSAVDVRCPHCRGASFTLYENLETAHVFRVEEGQALPMHKDESLPSQTGFTATCDCGHMWTPRRRSALKVMDAEEAARRAIYER